MQEPHSEGVAHHADPESCAGDGNVAGEALTGENAGQVFSSEITSIGVPTRCCDGEGHTRRSVQRELPFDAAESQTLSMRGHSLRGNRETRKVPPPDGGGGRSGKAMPKPDSHADRESDGSIVPEKRTNNAPAVVAGAAESVEGRGPAKGNAGQVPSMPDAVPERHRSWGLLGVRLAAQRNKDTRFTALLHHITPELLTAGFFDLKRKACPGVDGVTWHEYHRDLEVRMADLHGRVQRGAYRPQPSKRAWIPKADGRQRPLDIAALEDKIVQQAVRTVLELIYENDFLGFSYGFRPGRSQHQALDALSVGITRKKVSWVLDADIRGYFDAIDHDWMLRFLEHRIADRRILRLIRKWLKAGVLEDGQWSATSAGTPQGAVISPLLANVYLHYVLDLWVKWWRSRRARGDLIIVRYADDFVIGFQHRSDAERFRGELQDRLQKFGLELHPEKTRLIEFGRYAESNRQQRGAGKPETLDFLGLTHYCSRTRHGRFVIKRRSSKKRMRAKLAQIKGELRHRMHASRDELGCWLRSVVRGWFQYHAVPFNRASLDQFRTQVIRLWHFTLRRRSQKGRRAWTWDRMQRLARHWLPPPRILHPHPSERLLVPT